MRQEATSKINAGIDLIPSRLLNEIDRENIVQLCDRAYSQDLRPMFAAFRDPVHLVIRGESKIVGHACLIERWLQVAEGVPMRTAFVEAVATDPEYQGRGFGSALMRRIMLEAEAHQFEIGGLSTGRIDYYRRLGWELWRGPLCYRLQGRVVSMPEENGAMVYRLSRTPALDLDRPLSVEWREGPEVW